MSPSTNKRSGPTSSIETLAIAPPIPPTAPTSPSLKKHEPDKIHTDMKAMNDNIDAILTKLN